MAVEEWDTAFKAVLDWTAIKGRFIRSNGGVSNLRYPLFLSCFNSIKLEPEPPFWEISAFQGKVKTPAKVGRSIGLHPSQTSLDEGGNTYVLDTVLERAIDAGLGLLGDAGYV